MCDNNTLSGVSSTSVTAIAQAGGIVTGAIQLRSSTTTFTAQNNFIYDNKKKAMTGGKINFYYPIYKLPTTLASNTTTIPTWAKRITINLFDLQSDNNIYIPYLRVAGTGQAFITTPPALFRGMTWGNTDTNAIIPWPSTGFIYLENAPTRADQIWSGKVVMDKIVDTNGNSVYIVRIQMGCQYVNANYSIGCGAFGFAGVLERIQLNAGTPQQFQGGYWQISCE